MTVMISCKKLVTVSPVANISTAIAYSDSTNTEANVNGIYYQLQQAGIMYTSTYFSTYPLLSDEAGIGSATNAFILEFSSNLITTSNTNVTSLWSNNFKTIYQANSVLENVKDLSFLSTAKKNQFMGEARFIRAYCYFILTSYFGKAPLATSSDYKVNDALSRSDTSVIYNFVIDELRAADSLLPSGYAAFGNARIRACREAAEGLLARVYLSKGDWANAESYATKVINSPLFTLQTILSNIWTANSPESIWEIWASSTSYAYQNFTAQSLLPVDASSSFLPSVIPSAKLVGSFEAGDARKTNYLSYQAAGNYYYVYKYRDRNTGTDQPKILRLAEMYLIRAEARAWQNNLSDAAADIDMIRNRAGLSNTTASTQPDLLSAIMQERYLELCFEGFRWLDLKRTGMADAVMGVYRPTTWKPAAKLLPVPATELGANPNLLPQNTGY
jgi:hypothetical protein